MPERCTLPGGVNVAYTTIHKGALKPLGGKKGKEGLPIPKGGVDNGLAPYITSLL